MHDLIAFLQARLAAEIEDTKGHDGSDYEYCWGLHVDPAHDVARAEAHQCIVENLAKVIDGGYIDDGEPVLAEHVLRQLGAAYAWHEDYQPGWKP